MVEFLQVLIIDQSFQFWEKQFDVGWIRECVVTSREDSDGHCDFADIVLGRFCLKANVGLETVLEMNNTAINWTVQRFLSYCVGTVFVRL